MPIYEFKCLCGKVFNLILSMMDRDKPQKCECGKKAKRKLSLPNLNGFDNLGRSINER